MPSWFRLKLWPTPDFRWHFFCYSSAVFDNALNVYEFLSVVVFGLQERLKNGGVCNAEEE